MVRWGVPPYEGVLSQGGFRIPPPADPLRISHTKLGGETVWQSEETITSHFIWEVELMDHKSHKAHKPESLFSSSLPYATPFDYLFFLDRYQYFDHFPGVWAQIIEQKATEKASKHLLPATIVPSQREDHFDGSWYHNPWPTPTGCSAESSPHSCRLRTRWGVRAMQNLTPCI